MEPTILSEPKAPDIEYITLETAQLISGLGKSSVYSVVGNPENHIRTRAFCLGERRRKKKRLIHYRDWLAYLDRLPVDLGPHFPQKGRNESQARNTEVQV